MPIDDFASRVSSFAAERQAEQAAHQAQIANHQQQRMAQAQLNIQSFLAYMKSRDIKPQVIERQCRIYSQPKRRGGRAPFPQWQTITPSLHGWEILDTFLNDEVSSYRVALLTDGQLIYLSTTDRSKLVMDHPENKPNELQLASYRLPDLADETILIKAAARYA